MVASFCYTSYKYYNSTNVMVTVSVRSKFEPKLHYTRQNLQFTARTFGTGNRKIKRYVNSVVYTSILCSVLHTLKSSNGHSFRSSLIIIIIKKTQLFISRERSFLYCFITLTNFLRVATILQVAFREKLRTIIE